MQEYQVLSGNHTNILLRAHLHRSFRIFKNCVTAAYHLFLEMGFETNQLCTIRIKCFIASNTELYVSTHDPYFPSHILIHTQVFLRNINDRYRFVIF